MNLRFLLPIYLFALLAVAPAAMAWTPERLDRGLVAIKTDDGVFLSWRLRATENGASFAVKKNGRLWQYVMSNASTCLTDPKGTLDDTYQVFVVQNSAMTDSSRVMSPSPTDYIQLSLDRPAGGNTPPTYLSTSSATEPRFVPKGIAYEYAPGEGACGDLDGDGEYEIIVKWDPQHCTFDNAHGGISGEVIIDAYKMSGKRLWRISMGKNIRAGAHYTQMLVYDFDNDGKAEIALRTAPGTRDGLGQLVLLPGDDPNADYRVTAKENPRRCGIIKTGPEYLTVFRGADGAALSTVPFQPERGESSSWGDDYANRSDRFLACVAYLDGIHPSIVECRGYYMKSAVAAFLFDGTQLKEQWRVVSDTPGEGIYAAGNHNLSVADVDGDGCDEIVHSCCVIDGDGSVLYNTLLGHGDAMHIGHLDPSRPGIQVFTVHEKEPAIHTAGMEMHDALTGEILWQMPTATDNGRGMAADIDPRHAGYEFWSAQTKGLYDCHGRQIAASKPRWSSFTTYWDGDLLAELYNGNAIYKWDWEHETTNIIKEMPGATNTNGTKQTPFLQADLFGDWREELVLNVKGDPTTLRIYTTTIPTRHRRPTLMDNPQYRMSVVWQNVAYNQPPHTSDF